MPPLRRRQAAWFSEYAPVDRLRGQAQAVHPARRWLRQGLVITLDAIEYAAQADVAVLASGDGDFYLLAQKIREVHGKPVEVYGVPRLTANSLIQAASQFIPIERDLLLG